MIRDLHHQGLNISQISRETGYIQCENTLLPKPCQYRLPEGHGRANSILIMSISRIAFQEYPLSGARVHLRLHNSQGIRPKDPSCWRSTGTTSVRDQTRGPGPVDWGECDRIEADGRTRIMPDQHPPGRRQRPAPRHTPRRRTHPARSQVSLRASERAAGCRHRAATLPSRSKAAQA